MRIDSHAHLSAGAKSLEQLLASMNRLSIERAVVVGGGLVSPQKLAQGLEIEKARELYFDHLGLLTQCSQASGRLLPFYFANPWMAPDEYLNTGDKFFGLKLGPAVHGVPLNSELTFAYVSVAKSLGHPVYLHCLDRPGFRVSDLVSLAQSYPSVTFILGHGGIGHLDFKGVDEIAHSVNIYYETSGAFKAVVKHACTILGTERILFGSEYPLQSASAELVKIIDLDLSAKDFSAVMGGNIARILGRP